MGESLRASCRCGKVVFEAIGAPIVSAVCYCASCQKAGGQFEQLTGAPSVLDVDGGTSFILHRKDRVRCLSGSEHLQEFHLMPKAPTRRVVAMCCNSAMFLEFHKGHWLSLYRNRFTTDAPPMEMRVMTKHRRQGVVLPDDVPNYAVHSGKFMWKLFAAWVAMGLRVPPTIEGVTMPERSHSG